MVTASLVTNFIIEKILGLLTDEAELFDGVEANFEKLKFQLKIFNSSLENADNLKLLEKAAEVAQRLESVIGTYVMRMAQCRRHQNDFARTLESEGPSLASEIQDSMVELQWIEQKASDEIMRENAGWGLLRWRLELGLSPCDFESEERSFRWFESDLYRSIVIDSLKEQLMSLLVGKQSTHLVISVVGTGGVGKTTLANTIYESSEVKQHFDFHAWIHVSKTYTFERILSDLIISTNGGTLVIDEAVTRKELAGEFSRYLSRRRYVIVFDNVWETNFWKNIKHIFPRTQKHSRIIITTRNNATAASCDIVKTLQPFSEESAFELFCKRVFGSKSKNKCPPGLKMLSLQTVRRCHGLPLVITAIADILSTKKKVSSEWKKVLRHLNEFKENPYPNDIVYRIFYRSYVDLPHNIRLCFWYFGIFPKDYLVPEQKLVRLWIAEGFVKEEINKTLEQVAETYLNEFINRSLVQVSYMNNYGMERMCRVDGFMYDSILSSANNFGIYQIFKSGSSRRKIRHLSIYGDVKNILENVEHSKVRSVFFFHVNDLMGQSFLVNLFERLTLLELLDFENAPIDYLPDEVGNLFFLKYLSLRNTKVKKLPKSVGLLLNLITLDVRNTLINELPIHIQNLRKLRHLLATAHTENISLLDRINGVMIREGIGCLENLQTLLTVDASSSGFGVMKELVKLRELRRLGISKLNSNMVKTLCASVEKMNHLESLSLYSSSDHEVFYFEPISSPPFFLRRLILKGRIEKLPDWISWLENLIVLGLNSSRLAVDPLKALHRLPNLVSLWLHRAFIGERLHFQQGSFQKPKQLVLTELHDLRMIRIERGALPLLEELKIGPSPGQLSSNMQVLRNLRVLEYYDMPYEFVLRLQPEGGSDSWKVKHVQSVLFWYRTRGTRYVSYKLGDPSLLAHAKDPLATNFYWHYSPLSFLNIDDDELSRTSSAEWNDQRSFFSDDIED